MENLEIDHVAKAARLEEKNTWLKILVGALIVVFVGGIFWAGAAYQRFSGMETHLISIDSQMTKIGDVQAELRSFRELRQEDQRRLEKLEEQLTRRTQ